MVMTPPVEVPLSWERLLRDERENLLNLQAGRFWLSLSDPPVLLLRGAWRRPPLTSLWALVGEDTPWIVGLFRRQNGGISFTCPAAHTVDLLQAVRVYHPRIPVVFSGGE